MTDSSKPISARTRAARLGDLVLLIAVVAVIPWWPTIAALLASVAALWMVRRSRLEQQRQQFEHQRAELLADHIREFQAQLRARLESPLATASTAVSPTADGDDPLHRGVRRRGVRRRGANLHHVISHELQTPLCAVEELLCILEDGVVGKLEDGQREVTAAALESTRVLRSYIDELVNLVRFDTGRQPLECRPCALDKLLGRVVSAARTARPGDAERVHLELDPELPPVEVDSERIERMLGTVIEHATESLTDERSLTVRATPHRATSDDGVVHAVRIDITEDGDDTPEPAEPAERPAKDTISAEDHALRGGLGLRLSICKEIVERHGGSIVSASRPGTGVTFCFTLPALAPATRIEVVPAAAGASDEQTVILQR